jgi:Gpi18-like mannosyltransferase
LRRPFAGLMLAGASAVVLSAVAIGARYAVWPVETHDYLDYTRRWYDTIRLEGFHSFSHRIADYTPPYLYTLYAISKLFPELSSLTATKLPGTIGDFLCSAIAFGFLRRRRPWPLPLAAAFAVLLSPTGIVNSALWGQSDSVYTAGLLGCLALLAAGRPWWAMASYAVALAIKLQSTFLLPLLVALAVRGVVPWRSFLLIPAAYVMVILPCWIAGRPLHELLFIYSDQIGQLEMLYLGAPNPYALASPLFHWKRFVALGLLVAAIAAVLFARAVARSRVPLTAEVSVTLGLAMLLLMPYVLPKMHERYFYAADVTAIVFAFFFPRRFFVPILVGLASLVAYMTYLLPEDALPLPIASLAMGIALVVVLKDARSQLLPDPGSAGPPERTAGG